MKNVTNTRLRTFVFILNNDFEKLIKKLFPKSHIGYGIGNIAINHNGKYCNINEPEVCKKLAEYFDVKSITKICLGSTNTGVWIEYKN